MVPVTLEGVRRNFGISSVYMYTATLVDIPKQRILNLGIERHEAIPLPALGAPSRSRLFAIDPLQDPLVVDEAV